MRRLLLVLALAALFFPSTQQSPVSLRWNLSFSDDFNGAAINPTAWSVYGKNGPTGDKCHDGANVVVSGGKVTLEVRLKKNVCSGFTTGAMCACQVTRQTYGKYEVRMKATSGDSKINLLLWGANQWPPEVDFAEFPAGGYGQARQVFNQTVHYSSQNLKIHTKTVADMTQWHTVGMEWSPGLITYTLDGVVQNTVTSNVPAEPMWLAIQTAAKPGVTMNADTIVDWVHVYTLG